MIQNFCRVLSTLRAQLRPSSSTSSVVQRCQTNSFRSNVRPLSFLGCVFAGSSQPSTELGREATRHCGSRRMAHCQMNGCRFARSCPPICRPMPSRRICIRLQRTVSLLLVPRARHSVGHIMRLNSVERLSPLWVETCRTLNGTNRPEADISSPSRVGARKPCPSAHSWSFTIQHAELASAAQARYRHVTLCIPVQWRGADAAAQYWPL